MTRGTCPPARTETPPFAFRDAAGKPIGYSLDICDIVIEEIAGELGKDIRVTYRAVTPENRFFAANVVNRVWQDLCGNGLVSTIDDLDTLDADERKLILDELAAKFATTAARGAGSQ